MLSKHVSILPIGSKEATVQHELKTKDIVVSLFTEDGEQVLLGLGSRMIIEDQDSVTFIFQGELLMPLKAVIVG